jgi:hypothetical protein
MRLHKTLPIDPAARDASAQPRGTVRPRRGHVLENSLTTGELFGPTGQWAFLKSPTGEVFNLDERWVNLLSAFLAARATLAQLVEQLIRNQQVVGSNPTGGSKKLNKINGL